MKQLLILICLLWAAPLAAQDLSRQSVLAEDEPGASSITWQPCGNPAPGSFDCAKLNVPLDYQQPDGEQITLALIRHPASLPDRRIGTLFFNQGGPGTPGTQTLPVWIDLLPGAVVQRFDIVSWDPRGVGDSGAVQCLANRMKKNLLFKDVPLASWPETLAQQKRWAKQFAQFGEQCQQRNGKLLASLSTADSARDLEQLRLALNEPSMNYLGTGYGTLLGATYANLFPQQLRAMVLDGNIDPQAWFADGGSTATRQDRDIAVGRTLKAFLTLCGRANPAECAFSAGSPAKTELRFSELAQQLAEHPLMLADHQIDDNAVMAMMNNALQTVSPQGCDSKGKSCLFQGWRQAARLLQTLWQASKHPKLASRHKPPVLISKATIAALTTQNLADPQRLAVQCAESPNRYPASQYSKLARQSLLRSGPIVPVLIWADQPCTSWPVKAAAPYKGPWNTPLPGTILLVNNTDDPSTPYRGAIAMRKALARSRLLTVNGYGHTALLNPSHCAKQIEASYLIDGALPAIGKTCQQNQTPFARKDN